VTKAMSRTSRRWSFEESRWSVRIL